MDTVKIKKATRADLDGTAELYDAVCDFLEAHENFPGWKKGIYPARADAEAALSNDSLYIAAADGRTVGTFALKHTPEKGYEGAAWLTPNDYSRILVLYTLAVHPNYYGHGIGEKLIDYALKTARSKGCVSVRLDVVRGNLPAEKLYRKCGFSFIETRSLGYEEYGLPWFNLYEKLL